MTHDLINYKANGSMGNVDRETRIKNAVAASPNIPDEKIKATLKPILADLAKAGYQVESLHQLRHQGMSWEAALPILLHWLSVVDDPSIKEEIVRCLSVPWLGNNATGTLIQEFEKTGQEHPFLAWTIGNALSIVDVKGFEQKIIELSKNSKYGMARQMLVFGLGRFHDSKAEDAAIEMLKDETVRLHAIGALAAMQSKRALPELEKLLKDKKAVIRKEARKTIAKIIR
jgi:hypothetical protein